MSAYILLSIQFILACDENKSIMFNQYGNIKMDWLQRGFPKVPIMSPNFFVDTFWCVGYTGNTKLGFK